MNTCRNCQGLIMEPGKFYGYAGPACHCPRPNVSWQQSPEISTLNEILKVLSRIESKLDKKD